MTVFSSLHRRHALAAALLGTVVSAGCAPAVTVATQPTATQRSSAAPPSPDPRIGLRPGLFNAGEAAWNLRLLSSTPPPREYIGVTNSDLAFTGNVAIQGNYRGILFWDISNPRQPALVRDFLCPASQNDVSVYRNLLFVSGEDLGARNDCGTQGVQQAASSERFRGIRIIDISDMRNPRLITNVQTCRGSHTHTVLEHPADRDNIYIYVSGSASVRPAEELPGCVNAPPSEDPNSALFRIEVIRVPLADPARAAIVSSPRIFNELTAPPTHGLAPEDRLVIDRARAAGLFVVELFGEAIVLPAQTTNPMLDSIVRARGGSGRPTAADTAALQQALPSILARMWGFDLPGEGSAGPTQCHDITVYPAVGLAGGACEGYGLLLDISDPINPRRLAAVADSNFSYWHSATFNNDGTRVLFTDEWGGGGGAKCRATDPREWGANAIFTIENRQNLRFGSYYKLPAPQSALENCVAHNGSLIPIPGRDVMVQSWYQGGISMFDWTDATNPIEIGFHDRGPVDAQEMGNAGSWSVYWYNGIIVSSEIGRGLDIFELLPSAHISQNEIDAAKSVRLDYFNAQGQPRFTWPPSFALARAYLDQLERGSGLAAARIAAVRQQLDGAERAAAGARRTQLQQLAPQLETDAVSARDGARMRLLVQAVRDLAGAN